MLREMMFYLEHVQATDGLSDRARNVLQFIAESYGNKDIAKQLGLSVKAAETHRGNIIA